MRVLPLVLLFLAAPGDASAQQFVCSSVRHGDTAARLALRLTDSAENRHEPWFQILDPTTSRFIPKAAYDSIRPGWKVCIARNAAAGWPQRQIAIPSDRAKPETGQLFARPAAIDSAYARMMAVAILAPLLATPVAKKYFDRRRAMLDSMSGFATAFVREFAQPLPRQHATDRPIRARLQCAPYRARLEILLAPNTGHSYPNLSDHKKNLEYDIERVLRLVPDQPFIRGEAYSRGDWVVIPFQVPATGATQAGVTQEGAK
jgi:hypothetical protein